MTQYKRVGRLKVADCLYQFINTQALNKTGLTPDKFWQGFEDIIQEYTPRNQFLLDKRDEFQSLIDTYHLENPDADLAHYKQYLLKIGYLLPEQTALSIDTQNVDAEIATMAGPQLVVPINNARYALNAVNARWGSLYDALYGTDVIAEDKGREKSKNYNPKRGASVVEKVRDYLDLFVPLAGGSHQESCAYFVDQGQCVVRLRDGSERCLVDPTQFVAYRGDLTSPSDLLFVHNGLHIHLVFDTNSIIAKHDHAKISDVMLESALTTIMDCEDSVAAVDAEDKTLVYSNWLGLMLGTLNLKMQKAQQTFTREMANDLCFTHAHGHQQHFNGRSLMFIRNVGHLMRNEAILLDDTPVFEGIMDGVITSLIAKHDILGNGRYKNSKAGSIYIVKPKMHGPEEVAFTNDLFASIEQLLDLKANTIKMGIMDEERRTSINLNACIAAAKSRVVFINTGFLDRTGDEIHTSMLAGPFAPKADLKQRKWIDAYEKSNVASGLKSSLSGRAQIGKGMWPIPDQMANMLSSKIVHPEAGANTAWVPSPTAATLHALHYHQVDVFEKQGLLVADDTTYLDDILDIPLMKPTQHLSPQQIQRELDNNVQGILGYVVRWVHQGVGCSKVLDINNVGLMEDRATLRISSQHIANWLYHGLVSAQQVDASLRKMAVLVDQQNKADPEYIPMSPQLEQSLGFNAARDLIFLGKEQANGYTEPLLHERRKQMKVRLSNKAKFVGAYS